MVEAATPAASAGRARVAAMAEGAMVAAAKGARAENT